VIKLGWYAAGLLALSGVIGIAVVSLVVGVALFVAGGALMAYALVVAAGRSRQFTIDVGGLFYSQAPKELKLALGAQVAISLVAATLRPSASFLILAPIFGLGLCGLWGARHGTFPMRET
jgi:hypothetical protein